MLKGPIALGTIRTSFALALRLFIQASTLLLVARMLGPEEFGAFAGVAALALILGAFSTFGMHLVLLGEVAKEPGRREKILPYAIPCTLLCGSLLLGIYLLISVYLLNDTGISIFVFLLIGITEMYLQPLFALMTTEQHALGRVARAQLLQLLPMVVRFIVAIIIYSQFFLHPLDAYALGYLMASVVSLVCGVCLLPSRWPSWHSWRLPYRQEYAGAFGYAVIGITRTGMAELDKTLALKLLPVGFAGVYVAASRIIGAITLPVTAMMLSALPRLFRADSDSQNTANLLGWIYIAALGYSLLLAAALWLFAPIFALIFGEQYWDIVEMIRWLCLAIPGMALRLVVGNALMALGKPWVRVGFEMVGLAILVIAGIILVDWLGPTGLPLAVACAEWTMAILGSAILVCIRLNDWNQKSKSKGY